jgi:drug/metabolite transporter (DMT)-like permease
VNRRNWILLMALAAMWGSSYLFIKIGLRDLSPAGVVFSRTALAALILLPFAIRSGGLAQLRPRAGRIFVLAALQVAGPFLLISAGERHIASSMTGILVAAAPIFTALFAVWLDQGERLYGRGLVGVALGIVGVGLLLGVDVGSSSTALAGGLMVVLASVGYALGGFALPRWFGGSHPPIALVTATMSASALMTLPLMLVNLPHHVGLDTIGAMSALGFGGTGIAFVIYYTLNYAVGPTRTSLVAYIAPVFAVVYGVTLLNERFTAATAAGIVLIVGGSWLSSLRSKLPAGSVDVAPAGESDRRRYAAPHERVAESLDGRAG